MQGKKAACGRQPQTGAASEDPGSNGMDACGLADSRRSKSPGPQENDPVAEEATIAAVGDEQGGRSCHTQCTGTMRMPLGPSALEEFPF